PSSLSTALRASFAPSRLRGLFFSRSRALAIVSAARYSARPMSSPPPMSREEFQARVVEIVRQRFPLVQIALASEDEFALSVNGAVAPLENLYRAALLHPGDIKHHVERWAVELLRASEGMPDAAA